MCEGGGELSKISSKRVEEELGEGTQRFLKRGGGQTGSRGGCLKKRGAGNPLQTMLIEHQALAMKPFNH